MGRTAVRASVVVPARNAERTLGECLDALARECVPGPDVEVIVVDDGSADATARLAARAGVRVLRVAGRGPAAARNEGARVARGSLIVFLDADTAPQPGWLREMLAPFEDPAVAGVKGRYISVQSPLVARFAQLEFEDKYARLERARTVDFIDTGTAAFRRDVFLAASGFDESFPIPSAEDVELGFRLAAQGARLVFNPRAVVRHRHAEQLFTYLRKKAQYGYYRVRVYRRHPDKALGDSYTPPLLGIQIALSGLSLATILLASVLSGRWRVVAGAMLGALAATTIPLANRAARQSLLLALLTPALVFARSVAQGAGLALGLTAQLLTFVARGPRSPGRGRRSEARPRAGWADRD